MVKSGQHAKNEILNKPKDEYSHGNKNLWNQRRRLIPMKLESRIKDDVIALTNAADGRNRYFKKHYGNRIAKRQAVDNFHIKESDNDYNNMNYESDDDDGFNNDEMDADELAFEGEDYIDGASKDTNNDEEGGYYDTQDYSGGDSEIDQEYYENEFSDYDEVSYDRKKRETSYEPVYYENDEDDSEDEEYIDSGGEEYDDEGEEYEEGDEEYEEGDEEYEEGDEEHEEGDEEHEEGDEEHEEGDEEHEEDDEEHEEGDEEYEEGDEEYEEGDEEYEEGDEEYEADSEEYEEGDGVALEDAEDNEEDWEEADVYNYNEDDDSSEMLEKEYFQNELDDSDEVFTRRRKRETGYGGVTTGEVSESEVDPEKDHEIIDEDVYETREWFEDEVQEDANNGLNTDSIDENVDYRQVEREDKSSPMMGREDDNDLGISYEDVEVNEDEADNGDYSMDDDDYDVDYDDSDDYDDDDSDDYDDDDSDDYEMDDVDENDDVVSSQDNYYYEEDDFDEANNYNQQDLFPDNYDNFQRRKKRDTPNHSSKLQQNRRTRKRRKERFITDLVKSYQHVTKNPINADKLIKGFKRGQQWAIDEARELVNTRNLLLNLKRTNYFGFDPPSKVVRTLRRVKRDASPMFINGFLNRYYSGDKELISRLRVKTMN